ncbi:tripartite tricarboxylate transporter substrate binding protein [Pusillimonas sp. TS35]|uniref:Bug family tripartite tricarboxylate transporter substrate binding protein n=1 Tax=Paracandidimonas lactea TaxID=2895524 RepID=UPI0013697E70|nr:tripartite tricarboxylate transporter substrate binding protein [Paracandidimonas lactea]MYN12439.1 tripartite tricarboxylate transporter substrate binding protein [Pusillimonas sp. TS35]
MKHPFRKLSPAAITGLSVSPRTLRRTLLAAPFALALALGAASQPAAAGNYPDRPIKIVIPYSAGGGTDTLARVITAQMSKTLDVPIVIVAKPGASTIIGTKDVINSPADGYTLLLSTNTTYSIVPHLFHTPPFDAQRDLIPISYVAYTPIMLGVNPKLPVKTLSEFISYARQNPGKVSYASYGIGTSTHLIAEIFQNETNTTLNHIPYKGVEAVHALAGGQVDAMFDGLFTGLPMVQSGRINALAVTQPKRSSFSPTIPSLAEFGFPGFDINIWYALSAPKGTPQAVIDRLYEAVSAALASDEVKTGLHKLQVVPVGLPPAQAQSFIRAQSELYRDIVKKANIPLS